MLKAYRLDRAVTWNLACLLTKEWYAKRDYNVRRILQVNFLAQEPLDVEYNLGDVSSKNRDFSNPMYDAVNTETGATNGTGASNMYELPAEMKPSSIQHKEPPQLHLKRRELDPTPIDSGKDTQQLVEEDKSEC